ncbi:MAG: DEAD/DEAH box helicase [Verrucomicrobia bacterium]|nr:DEAD/DEAH box helicase [Verrucomicrobiota bacterium]
MSGLLLNKKRSGNMSHTLDLTPSGNLHLREESVSRPVLSGALVEALRIALAKSTADGLLHLGSTLANAELPGTLPYWRTLALDFLGALRIQTPPDAVAPEPVPMPAAECWEAFLNQAPPGRGMEYLNLSVLESFWQGMQRVAFKAAADHADGIVGWLRDSNPLQQLVGRVTFHLAENKRDERRPFAFIATYTHALSEKAERLQYIPLGRALKQYAGKGDKPALERLLVPVQLAAEASPTVRELVDSRRIFQPLAWTPDQAWHFMNEIPAMEAAGLVVRIPDWWKAKRPPRPTVQVSMGSQASMMGINGMLDFSVGVALNGEVLSPDELVDLLEGDGNLVRLKGQWVEVDRDKLTEVLEHWIEVADNHYESGVSFLEGMRMLSGFGRASGAVAFDEDGQVGSWTEMHAGDWLRDVLVKMRDPSQAEDACPGEELHATLRPYQRAGVNWLWFVYQMGLGACLADDMGLGKTIQIIALLLAVKRRSRPGGKRREKAHSKHPPSLLVVPTSLLGNWRAELERFAPDLKPFFLHSSQTPKEARDAAEATPETFYSDYDLVVTTYGLLKRLNGISKQSWNLVILDEAQAIKNPNSTQTRSVKQLKAHSRIALSGTPIENRLGDLWSLFDFINPSLLGTPSQFKRLVKELESGSTPNYAPLRTLARPYILRRLKTDKSVISDLPDKTELRTWCQLTKVQAAHYQRAVSDLREALESDQVTGIQRRGLVLSFLQRFKQICNHPAQWGGTGDYSVKGSGKFQRLIGLCEEVASRQEKVLVFTQFREMTTPLATVLEEVFGQSGQILHGGTSVKQRQQLVNEFQREDGPPFFVLSLKAGGTGLNLTAASHVIHFDRWWNPAVEDQATDRAFRIGQKRNVLVHKFVCQGTIEEKIDQLISDKRALADDVLGNAGGAEKLLTEMDTDELLNFVAIDIDSALGA